MNIIEIVFSIFGIIAIVFVLVLLIKIDADNKKMLKKARHGEWIEKYGVYKCSCCNENALVVCDQYKETFEYLSDYCPHCGADMRERKETK